MDFNVESTNCINKLTSAHVFEINIYVHINISSDHCKKMHGKKCQISFDQRTDGIQRHSTNKVKQKHY